MREFEPSLAIAKKSSAASEAKVGFAAVQEMARLQEQEEQKKEGSCDLSFLRFDPQSNRMTLEGGPGAQAGQERSPQAYGRFPLEIPTPVHSPPPGHKLKRAGSFRLLIFYFIFCRFFLPFQFGVG